MREQYACAYLTDNGDLYTYLPKKKEQLDKWLKEMEESDYKAVVFKIQTQTDQEPAIIERDDYT